MVHRILQPAADLSVVRAVLWDVDGTLFSSEHIIHEVYQATFQRYQARTGRPARVPTLEEILREVGKPVRVIFQNLAPDLNEEERHQVGLGILHGLVTAITFGRGEHYAGVRETLHELAGRGYRFFSVSNGRYPYIEAILRANRLYNLFEGLPVVDNRSIRDKNELVAHVLDANKLSPDQAVVVGDRAADRDAAQVNRVPFIATTYGHGDAGEWAGAVASVDAPDELLALLPGIKK